MKIVVRNTIRDMAVYLVLCVVTFLMLKMIVEYTSFDNGVGFLRFKQEYLHLQTWKTAFYIHVFASIFTLFAGFTQFSSYLLKHHRPLHRIMGYIYVFDVLIINFPVAMIMAYYANGYLPTKIAFVLLDTLWFWFTLKALIAIRRGDIRVHKEFMIRSYALTFSAITLRTWKIILTSTSNMDAEIIYMIDAWLGFIPNLLLAEWIIRRKRGSERKLSFKPNVIENKPKNSQ